MSKKIIRWLQNDYDREMFFKFIQSQELPATVSYQNGLIKKRSNDQNSLQRLWISELAEQDTIGQTAEEYRAFIKLHFGVPILRNEDEEFRQAYDEKVKNNYSYEQKLGMMAIPVDFPVTRRMTVNQHKRFLDEVYVYYTSKGYKLSNPEDLKWVME